MIFNQDFKKEIIKKYISGFSMENLSLNYNCSLSAIRNILMKNQIKIRPRWKESKFNKFKNQIISLYLNKKFSAFKIAKIYNTSSDSIRNFLLKNNIKVRNIKQAANLNSIKFTNKQINNIIKLYKQQMIGSSLICKQFNCTPGVILKILKENKIKLRNGHFQRKYKLNDKYFDKLNNFYKNYYLGWMFSDGCNNEINHRISLGLHSKDKYIIDKFTQLLNISHPKKTIKNIITNIGNPFTTFAFTSTKISEKLAEYGCIQSKSLTLKFPKKISQKYMYAFILGIFEGDGCISKYYDKTKKYINFRFFIFGTLDLLTGIQNTLLKFNQQFASNIIRKGSIYQLSVGKRDSLYFLYKFLYNKTPFFLKRKKKIFDKFIKHFKYEI